MIKSQEIIERSVYDALLRVTIALGYTIDPATYLPVSPTNNVQYQADKKAIEDNHPPFIYIFGAGNSLSRDAKETPRIVVEPHGFYPGTMGLPKEIIDEKTGLGYSAYESPNEAINQYIDIHIVSKHRKDLRLLNQILYWSIPNRGYIKVYSKPVLQTSNNIFIELANYADRDSYQYGLIENVYTFKVSDVYFPDDLFPRDIITPIEDISALIEHPKGETIKIHIKK